MAHGQGRIDGGGYWYFIPPPQKKSSQVNFLWGKNDVERLFNSFIPPKKTFIPPQNKFLATPLLTVYIS